MQWLLQLETYSLAHDDALSSYSRTERDFAPHCLARSGGIRPFMRSDHLQRATETPPARSPQIEYRPCGSAADNALAIVRFGSAGAPLVDTFSDTLEIHVGLDPLGTSSPDAIWLATGPVVRARHGRIRYAHDGEFLFGVIEEPEAGHPDIRTATAAVYASIDQFQRTSPFPHLVRMWNFLDAVNEGDGDYERYRQFCVGRAEGFGESARAGYPAATAIGRQERSGVLQVFWIAAKRPGRAVENPRQISAYRYPRAHGPVSPSFSRATILPDGALLVSGTASIVGHASQHPNDPHAQFAETLRNLDALIAHAGQYGTCALAAADLSFTVYVRDPAHAEPIAQHLRNAFPDARAIVVGADICRRELLLEIECVLQPRV